MTNLETPTAHTTMEAFRKIDFRIGRIISACVFEGIRKPSYKLEVDFGAELGIKRSSAQLTFAYPNPELLIDKLVVSVVNFAPRQIGKFMSQVLVTGFYADEKSVMVLTCNGNGSSSCNGAITDLQVQLGSRIGILDVDSQFRCSEYSSIITFDDFLACKIVVGKLKAFEDLHEFAVFDCGAFGDIRCRILKNRLLEVGQLLPLVDLGDKTGALLVVDDKDPCYLKPDQPVPSGSILA